MLMRPRGFTLVEVLAALAVLAIALSAVIAGMLRYGDNAGHLRNKTIAYAVAHNRLTELQLEPGWPSEGRSDGEVEMAGQKWRWEAEVKKTPDEHLRRIDIRVNFASAKGKEREEGGLVSLSAFMADTGRNALTQ